MVQQRYDGQLDTALLKKDLEYIKGEVGDVKNEMGSLRKDIREGYTSKTEFEPVQRLVYGMVGIILVAVVGALIALVIQ